MTLSARWAVFITIWLGTASLGLAGDVLLLTTWGGDNPDRRSSVTLTMLASLPSTAAAFEFVARLYSGSLSGEYFARIPLLIGLVAGPLLFLASYAVYPLVRDKSDGVVNGVRLVHLMHWACGALVYVMLLLSI